VSYIVFLLICSDLVLQRLYESKLTFALQLVSIAAFGRTLRVASLAGWGLVLLLLGDCLGVVQVSETLLVNLESLVIKRTVLADLLAKLL